MFGDSPAPGDPFSAGPQGVPGIDGNHKIPVACGGCTASPAELRTDHKNGNKLDFTSPMQLLWAWWAQVNTAGFIALCSKILQAQNLPPLKVILSQSI